MNEIQKGKEYLRACFQNKGFSYQFIVSQKSMLNILDALSGSPFDRELANELFSQCKTNFRNDICIDNFIDVILNAHQLLNAKITESNEAIQEYSLQRNECYYQIQKTKSDKSAPKLLIQVIEASDIYDGATDVTQKPYVVLTCDKDKQSTPLAKNSKFAPKWNYQCSFEIKTGKEQVFASVLSLDSLQKTHLLGEAHFSLPELDDQLRHNQWFQLYDRRGQAKNGRVHLELQLLKDSHQYYSEAMKNIDRFLVAINREKQDYQNQLHQLYTPFQAKVLQNAQPNVIIDGPELMFVHELSRPVIYRGEKKVDLNVLRNPYIKEEKVCEILNVRDKREIYIDPSEAYPAQEDLEMKTNFGLDEVSGSMKVLCLLIVVYVGLSVFLCFLRDDFINVSHHALAVRVVRDPAELLRRRVPQHHLGVPPAHGRPRPGVGHDLPERLVGRPRQDQHAGGARPARARTGHHRGQLRHDPPQARPRLPALETQARHPVPQLQVPVRARHVPLLPRRRQPLHRLLQAAPLTLSQFYLYKTMASITPNQKILVNRSIRDWDKNYVFHPFNLDELYSIFLNEDQKFLDIKNHISNFNQELQRFPSKRVKIPFGPTRHVFYQKLVNLTREIMFTKDKQQQQIQLKKVHSWAEKQIKLFEDMIKKKSEKVNIQKLLSNQITKTDTTQCSATMPSDIITNQLKDYEDHARTRHPSVDDPAIRLQEYKTRQMTQVFTTLATPTIQTFPKNYDSFKPQNTTLFASTIKNEENKTEEDKEIETLAQELEKHQQQQKEESMEPRIEVFKEDRDMRVYEEKGEFETKCAYASYVPSKEESELRMQRMWMKQRNKGVADKRMDEEFVEIMGKWAKNKSRVAKEMNRKLETKRYGNEYEFVSFQVEEPNKSLEEVTGKKEPARNRTLSYDVKNLKVDQSALQDSSDVRTVDFSRNLPRVTRTLATEEEKGIARKRMNNAKMLYGKILGIRNHGSASVDASEAKTLSIHQNPNRSFDMPSRFSHLLRRMSPENQQADQLEEIQEVKNRMAKYRINVPYNKLLKAIATPHLNNDLLNNSLPEPGYGYLVNPYEEEQKKPKKGPKLKLN